MLATVYKSTGSWYSLKTENNEWVEGRVAGKLRLKGTRSTNPVAVGDVVSIREESEGNVIIEGIEIRNNCITRKSNNLSHQTQILASNIDTLLIIASIKNPRTSLGFIDRLTVAAVAYKIAPIICINKKDIWSPQDQEYFTSIKNIYENAGFKVVATSANTKDGIDELFTLLKGKRVLLSGHSGVGKSSLLNAFNPNLELRVGAISDSTLKGKHTTTFAEMMDIDEQTQFIDSPGIRDFGLIEIKEEELNTYFPELFALLPQCKYYNCKHNVEPKCAVIKAVKEDEIPKSRYLSYLSILANEDIYQ